jgi:hypothetical protein
MSTPRPQQRVQIWAKPARWAMAGPAAPPLRPHTALQAQTRRFCFHGTTGGAYRASTVALDEERECLAVQAAGAMAVVRLVVDGE